MISEKEGVGHAQPHWFIDPGHTDYLAVIVIILLLLGLYGIVYLYATFDRWAERNSSNTPLARTIPTLLAIALVYEIFPVDHFHAFLPLSAILIALMADWSRFHLHKSSSDRLPAPHSGMEQGHTGQHEFNEVDMGKGPDKVRDV